MSTELSATVRLTVDLSFHSANSLHRLASKQGVIMTESLRRVIATESLIQAHCRAGGKVLLETEGKLSELIFTR